MATPSPFGVLVPIAPCRVLDSASVPAATAAEEKVRRVNIRATRCGQIIPAYAKAYSLQITNYSRTAPENLPVGAAPARSTSTLPVSQTGLFDFPVPSDAHIAVDVDGYYVAAGTPIGPISASSTIGAGGASTISAQSVQPRQLQPMADLPGSSGAVYVDSPAEVSAAGILLKATTTGRPWIVAKGSTSDAASGFSFVNASNLDIMHVRSDGAVQLPTSAFFDGRSDFFGSSYYGYISIPTNVVHDVTLINPHDAAGGATTRVIFFNAQSDDEASSPSLTKYRASTMGFYGDSQENVNFESELRYHRGNFYHFRARSTAPQTFSPAQPILDTFWVKAATSGDSLTGTRADMYVSGKVGVGKLTPSEALEVNGAIKVYGTTSAVQANTGSLDYLTNGARIVSFGPNTTTPATFQLVLRSSDSSAGSTPLSVNNQGNVGIGTTAPAARLDVSGTANVSGNATVGGSLTVSGTITGATVIHATFQDLAEWVPSGQRLAPGTVVIIDRGTTNGVAPSTRAYDTGVAGVASAHPGLILGVEADSKSQVATTGRVRVRVDASRHPIAVGDILVTADKPGMAMYSEPIDVGGVKIHRPGTIVGKALEPLTGGEGEILVLLSLQ